MPGFDWLGAWTGLRAYFPIFIDCRVNGALPG